jgi:hypothetical protein
MFVWIAIAVTCASPLASDCQMATYPQTFSESVDCQSQVEKFIFATRLKGLITFGGCHRVEVAGEFL